mmetsp:Transcript_18834/g.28640  ORF Transcript_18834/g.28640 Transcript_18834/m.28640 type:complete len:174 (+) Transcript_18834:282-803(+)|eukprot:CAMPEP_0194091816 /NCGR_PEP_ID=MMETSP0149-20130528/44603_1 /TAXON_ID=122233 /ORGANISM="Chaetoceros debilis, Strain MM31A-1" /LENGTH=173 /DNA_ID=CAMNT_0038776557 /DNA_START=133 /DNA_END=657 /DNA_ORIENTATION=-
MDANKIIVTPEDHDRFISALEKNGTVMRGDEWVKIASELSWSIEDVKTYAYWYMQELFKSLQDKRSADHDVETAPVEISEEMKEKASHHDEARLQGVINVDEIESRSSSQFVLTNQWTYDECILFDNLLLAYPKERKDKGMLIRWRKISSMLPNKSADDCKERYSLFYDLIKR